MENFLNAFLQNETAIFILILIFLVVAMLRFLYEFAETQTKTAATYLYTMSRVDEEATDHLNQTVVISHSQKKISQIREDLIINNNKWKEKRSKINDEMLKELKKLTDKKWTDVFNVFKFLLQLLNIKK